MTDRIDASTDPDQGWSVTSSRDEDRLTLALSGELDLHTADGVDVDTVLPDTDVTGVALDLSGVTFIDSVGLGLVLRLRQRAREIGAAAEIVSWPQHVGLFGDPPASAPGGAPEEAPA